ncbi:hypothetical protein BC834DRAFT_862747 [Gloeopeniophorella convolvens]|nr:hypothetical protein BC834DRAFT_862747 [Gloeopeniophorella convolvens]
MKPGSRGIVSVFGWRWYHSTGRSLSSNVETESYSRYMYIYSERTATVGRHRVGEAQTSGRRAER